MGVDFVGIDTFGNLKNGVLTISLPKKPEALKAEKKISIKAS